MAYQLTKQSENKKTGPMPVSISEASTCPSTCPLLNAGCYAQQGPLSWHWRKVSDGRRGDSFANLTKTIAELPDGQVWRHNQAGDLPGPDTTVDPMALQQLVDVNKDKRGFTYTHKPILNHAEAERNREAIKSANAQGFTVNLSSSNVAEADAMLDLGIAPVVTILPLSTPKLSKAPQGAKIVACPAQYNDKVTCASCKLCAIRDRNLVIGFEAHGVSKRKVNKKAEVI